MWVLYSFLNPIIPLWGVTNLMSRRLSNTRVLPVDDQAEGAHEWRDMPMNDFEGGALVERGDELPLPLILPQPMPPSDAALVCHPPTAETGTMPIVVMDTEAADDIDRQDATRTTAELQVAATALVGR